MANAKNKQVICPDCKTRRFVFNTVYATKLRCLNCTKLARKKASAERGSRVMPKAPVVCPSCHQSRMVSANHAANCARRGGSVVCSSCAAGRMGQPLPTICRHCNKSKVNRPRGLCWSCYYAPGVRERYGSTSKYASRGNGNFNSLSPLPPNPTTALPGTPEKVLVLVERAKAGQSLFHPLDAKHEEGRESALEFLRGEFAA